MKKALVLIAFVAQYQVFAGEVPSVLPSPATGQPQFPAAVPDANPASSPIAFSYADGWAERRPFESDRAFSGFIGPISNPVLSKDPRALTELRGLFVGDWIPSENPLGPGDFQVYGLQARVALTDRLSLIADKDGIARIKTNSSNETGMLDIAFGLKYALVRDVENQFLFTVGTMYEPSTGEAKVFQHQGSGMFTFFVSSGKEFEGCWHLLANAGYQVPLDQGENSSFYYAQLHLDRQLFGWLYPLVECNWYHWVAGGQRIPNPAVGEIDGLINLGTSGVAGNDLVTVAAGVKAIINCHVETGIAYETPISNRKDFIDNRVLFEVIFRY